MTYAKRIGLEGELNFYDIRIPNTVYCPTQPILLSLSS